MLSVTNVVSNFKRSSDTKINAPNHIYYPLTGFPRIMENLENQLVIYFKRLKSLIFLSLLLLLMKAKLPATHG